MALQQLWLKAKKKFKLKQNQKRDFIEHCEQYKRQHGHYPHVENMEKQKIHGLAKEVNFLVSLGEAPAIMYRPGKHSRKGNHNYLHPTKKQKLLTDKSGKILIYTGKTKMKKDGWLHH